MDALGWNKLEVVTAATIVVRMNSATSDLYKDKAVRQAIQLAVDNAGRAGTGLQQPRHTAENHHACPIHPEYAELPPQVDRPGQAARPRWKRPGMADAEIEIISLDDDWQARPPRAVVAQLKDAGANVKRTVMPGSTFWNDWQKYPFSSTTWNHRPLGVQNMALAYTSTGSWNESGMANAEFDARWSRRCRWPMPTPGVNRW